MTRQARVGLLVLAGAVLFMVALFTIANRTFLFSDTFFVRSTFYSVNGLLPGAPVRYQGVNVGRVEAVRLPERPGDKILVELAIQEKARHLIRENTQAQVQTDGLVGNMIVTLVANATPADPVREGGEIPGLEPFSITNVTEQALSSVQRFNEAAEAFQLIMQDVRDGEGTIGRFLYDPALYASLVQTAGETQVLMQRLGQNAEQLVGATQNAAQGVDLMLSKINNGSGSLALLLNDPGVYQTMLRASDTLLTISTDIRNVTRNAEEMTAWGAVAAFRGAELTEALKENFLFKRYFERRGYTEQAPFEIREQAIRASHQEIEERQRELYEWQQRLEAREAALQAAPVPVRAPTDTLRTGSNR